MSWTPISNTEPQYEENNVAASGFYIKFYAAGTTTPVSMATDSTGGTLLAKAQLDTQGYPINGSSAIFIPHINQRYKIALFRNATDADSNNLANAAWDVDNLDPVATVTNSAFTKNFDTLADAVASTGLVDGDALNIKERTTGNGGGATWDVVLSSTVTENTYNIVQCTGVPTLSLVLREDNGDSYASQWGVNASNTAAVNTPALQALWDNAPKRIYYPVGVVLVTQLNLPDATIEHVGTIDQRGAATSGLRYDSGGSGTAPVINLSSMSAGNSSVFRNLLIDTGDTAQYGFYLASGTSFQAIKNMKFHNMWVINLKGGAVGWQCGDQSNTTFDTDAFNFTWYDCNTRGSTDSIGWVFDATNLYNAGLYNCSNGRKDGSNFMLSALKVIRGSGIRLYNFWIDKLQSTGTPWGIDHAGGTIEVYGCNTEDRRVCKARSNGENDSSLLMTGVSVNDETGDGDTCLDTTIRTSLDNCTFGSASFDRTLTATNQLTTNHVFLGSGGEYDLSGIALNSSVIEGHAIGSKLDNIAVNEICDLWVNTSDPAAPEGWVVQKGTGTGTVARATTNAAQGQYVLDINCTVTSSDIFGVINKNYTDIDVRPFRGKSINFYGVFHRDGTATPEIQVLLDGGTTNVIGGSVVLETAASGGTVLVWGKVDVQPTSNTLSQIEMGIPATQTGRVYLDSFGVIPYDFSSYVPALFVLAQNTGYDRFVSEIRAGTLRLGDATYWTDGSNKFRINVGERISDTDGTIVGTQS